MTSTQTTSGTTKLAGLLAEFSDPAALVEAAGQLRAAGYRQLDAFTPFPVHGLDRALGMRPTRLPWLVLLAGLTGAVVALAGQWWTNAVDYPYWISGKPLFSLPANIPVTFEVIVLSSAITAFLGMLAFVGLPQLANALFSSDRFRRASDDGFFLWVAADDRQFAEQRTAADLRAAGAEHVERCEELGTRPALPRGLVPALLVLALLALVPPLLIARARAAVTSPRPGLRSFRDMDFQPKFKPQTTISSRIFADGRAMRAPVPGTVARGELATDTRYHQGIEPEAVPLARIGRDSSAFRNAAFLAAAGPGSAEPAPPADAAPSPQTSTAPGAADVAAEPNYVRDFPLPVTAELMQRGRERFNISCAPCHGRAGDGDGVISQRALELQQGTWLPPTSLHVDYLLQQPVGKIFQTITNGIRKMPAYGNQIPTEDRWAIVAYVRALQKTRNATLADVPADRLPRLRDSQ